MIGNPTSPDQFRKLRNRAMAVFAVMVGAYFFVYFQRMSVGVVGYDMVEDLGGSIGILSTVYYWTYTAMQIPSGIMADRFGSRASGTLFLMLASAGSFLTFAGTEFWMAVVGKVMIAAGMAVVYIPLMKLVSVWFPRQDFAILNGITIAVGNIGAVAAAGPLSMLSDAVGWRNVFLVLGAVTALFASLCFVVVRDHPKQAGLPSREQADALSGNVSSNDATDAKMPVLEGLKAVFSGGRKFWNCALAYFLVYGTITVFQGTWAVRYFDSVYGFVLSSAWMVTMIGIGKIISTILVGAAVSRGYITSKRRVMTFGTACFAAVWGIVFLFAGQIDDYWFWFALSAAFGFFGGFMSLSFAQVKEWYPIAIAGTSVSAMNIFLFLGASVSTTISAAIVGTDYTLSSFSTLWGVMFAFALIATVLISTSVEKEAEKLDVAK